MCPGAGVGRRQENAGGKGRGTGDRQEGTSRGRHRGTLLPEKGPIVGKGTCDQAHPINGSLTPPRAGGPSVCGHSACRQDPGQGPGLEGRCPWLTAGTGSRSLHTLAAHTPHLVLKCLPPHRHPTLLPPVPQREAGCACAQDVSSTLSAWVSPGPGRVSSGCSSSMHTHHLVNTGDTIFLSRRTPGTAPHLLGLRGRTSGSRGARAVPHLENDKYQSSRVVLGGLIRNAGAVREPFRALLPPRVAGT